MGKRLEQALHKTKETSDLLTHEKLLNPICHQENVN